MTALWGRTTAPHVVVVGDVMRDVVAVLDAPLNVGSDTSGCVRAGGGGSAANVAAWLAAQQVPAMWVGRVGADAAGRELVDELEAGGVRCAVTVDEEARSGSCVVLVAPDGERSMVPDPGANARLTPEDLPEAEFRPGRHLHVSAYPLFSPRSREAVLAAVDLARDRRMTVSVDPSSAAPLAHLGADVFLAWTRGASVVLPNALEAQVLTGEADPRMAAAALAEHYAEVVVTLGAAGARWHAGFLTATVPPADAPGPVLDTTGAGDAFTAGFLAGWLLHPEPETALGTGARMAAAAVRRIGARPPRPSYPAG